MEENIMYKTLHGKDNYLFLINDSNQELKQHFSNFTFDIKVLNNVCEYIKRNTSKYKNYIIFILPDKSVIYPEYLPKEYDKYNKNKIQRFSVNYIKKKVGSYVIDLYDFIIQCKQLGIQTYPKTDTHISPLMSLYLVKHILYNIDNTIEFPEFDLKEITFYGDLTSEINNGKRPYVPEKILIPDHNIKYSVKYFRYENNKLNDIQIENYWFPDIDRRNIVIYLTNPNASNNHKLLLFGTSFSEKMKDFYILFVHEVYFIYSRVNDDLIDLISPTYIINERVERGLNK